MSRKGVVTFLIAGLATAAVVLAVSTGFYLRSARSKEKKLENLFNYEAPIFVWDKEALAPGETVSPLLKQTPIRLPDGHIETDKAVQIQRGTWSDGQFTVGAEGSWFMLTLFKNEDVKGTTVGQLLPQGYGAAVTCKPPGTPPKPKPPEPLPPTSETFDCYFIVRLQPNGGVDLHWTMFHGGESGSATNQMHESPESGMRV